MHNAILDHEKNGPRDPSAEKISGVELYHPHCVTNSVNRMQFELVPNNLEVNDQEFSLVNTVTNDKMLIGSEPVPVD